MTRQRVAASASPLSADWTILETGEWGRLAFSQIGDLRVLAVFQGSVQQWAVLLSREQVARLWASFPEERAGAE